MKVLNFYILFFCFFLSSCAKIDSKGFVYHDVVERKVEIKEIPWNKIYEKKKIKKTAKVKKVKPKINYKNKHKKEIEKYFANLRKDRILRRQNWAKNLRLDELRKNNKKDYRFVKGLSLKEYWYEN